MAQRRKSPKKVLPKGDRVRVHGASESPPDPVTRAVEVPNLEPGFFKVLRLQMQNNPLTQPLAQHPWLYAAVKAISCNIAGVPHRIVSGKMENPKPVEKSDWITLFDSPNPIMSRYQLWEATMDFLSLEGEAIWVLQGKPGKDGKFQPRKEGEVPSEIWVNPPKQFEPLVENQVLIGWVFTDPKTQQKQTMGLAEVIQFKYWNPYNPWRGLAPLRAAEMAVRHDHKAGVFDESFLDNGADVGGVITGPKQPSATQEKQIIERWEERHQGPNKRGKTAFLWGGMEYQFNPSTHRDMEFLEGRKWARDQILAVYKVPKSEVSVYEDLNFATARSQDEGFWQKTLIPKMRYIEDVLWQRLFSKVNGGREWGVFDLSVVEALQEDFAEKVKTAQTLVFMGYDLNAVNERLQLGMPTVEERPEPEPPSEPDPQEQKTVRRGLAYAAGRLEFWQKFARAALDPRERRMMAKLRVYFGSQKREVLNRFAEVARGIGPDAFTRDLTPSQVERILFVEEEWNQKLKKMVKPLYHEAAKAAIELVSDELGGLQKFGALDPHLLRFLEQKAIKVTSVNHTVREKLRQTLFDGIDAKETISQLQDRLKGVYNLAGGDARRLMIARTETAQVANGTRQLAFKEEGVTRHEWVTAGDEHVRDSHVEMNGVVVNVGSQFPNGIRYPGDITGPPGETVNCRCVAVAVRDEEAEADESEGDE